MAFYDDTDNLAGGDDFRTKKGFEKTGAVIQFYHVPTIKAALENGSGISSATFKAFITAFKDNFKVNWNSKDTFGRMDAIQTYKNTQRNISLSFDVPSFSEEEALANFIELHKLITMQYPVYETKNLITAKEESAPNHDAEYFQLSNKVEQEKLKAIALVNAKSDSNSEQKATELALIEKQAADYQDRIGKSIEQSTQLKLSQQSQVLNTQSGPRLKFMSSPPLLYIKFMNLISSTDDRSNIQKHVDVSDALVGIVSEVSFEPDVEQGFHFMHSKLVPKLFNINLTITVIHTSELGWTNLPVNSSQPLKHYLFGEPTSAADNPRFKSYKLFPYGNADVLPEE